MSKVSFIHSMVDRTIKSLKKDSEYGFDQSTTSKEIFTLLKIRGFEFLRGALKKYKFKSVKGFCFIGSNVKIEFGYHISIGRSCIFEQDVYINAFSHNGILLGDNVTIAKKTILQCTGVVSHKGVGITIGNNCAIGALSYLGGQGGIKIGNDVLMGPGVKIFSENHNFDSRDICIRKQGVNRSSVIINDNCWIGSGATILNGVEIGSGSIIAAGAVVTKSTPVNSISAGIPARIIRNRV
jgi:acetyltransferase-like isoleucine patch superfamily enzyme